jgi:hypothetical protein
MDLAPNDFRENSRKCIQAIRDPRPGGAVGKE